MDKKTNKTVVINKLNVHLLPKSYSWTNHRNTFPSRHWIDIFYYFIINGGGRKNKTIIEKKYKPYLTKSNFDKKDNNMHVNVLFKKLLFSEKQDYKELKQLSFVDLRKKIHNFINDVIREMSKHDIPNNWQKIIDEWEGSNIDNEDSSGEIDIIKYENSEIENLHERTIKNNNYNNINYDFVDQVRFYNDQNENYPNTISDLNKKKIGKIGEKIVYELLQKKYGISKVCHTSYIDPYSPYDISYKDKNNKKIYVEVKSSTKLNTMNWYISRSEYNFYVKNKSKYEIFFVKDINKFSNKGAIIQKIFQPEIVITKNQFGTKSSKLIVTPISYKGAV